MPAALRRGSRSRRERLEAEGARGRDQGGPEASTSGSGGREPGPRRGSGAGRRLRLPLALAAAAVHVVNVHADLAQKSQPSTTSRRRLATHRRDSDPPSNTVACINAHIPVGAYLYMQHSNHIFDLLPP